MFVNMDGCPFTLPQGYSTGEGQCVPTHCKAAYEGCFP